MAPNLPTTFKDPNDRCRISLAETLPTLAAAGVLVKVLAQPVMSQEPAALRIDSRRIASGDVFLAISGTKNDGHDHLEAAIRAGASLLILEREAAFPARSTECRE